MPSVTPPTSWRHDDQPPDPDGSPPLQWTIIPTSAAISGLDSGVRNEPVRIPTDAETSPSAAGTGATGKLLTAIIGGAGGGLALILSAMAASAVPVGLGYLAISVFGAIVITAVGAMASGRRR